jgi:hypothetical protein
MTFIEYKEFWGSVTSKLYQWKIAQNIIHSKLNEAETEVKIVQFIGRIENTSKPLNNGFL